MNRLPWELLPLIIEQVDQPDLVACSLVNKTFYATTLPFLWHTYTEKPDHDAVLVAVHLTCKRHPLSKYARKLVLCQQWDSSELLFLSFKIHHHFEALTLTCGQHANDASYQPLVETCPNLKTLKLLTFQLTQPFMDAIGQHCKHLEQLDLYYCGDPVSTTNTPFTTLMQHGCPLKRVMMLSHGKYTDRKLATLMDLARVSQLTQLGFPDDSNDIMEHFVSIATTAWPRLTHLTMSHLGSMGDTQLIPLLQSHPRLQYLSLLPSDLTDATLDAMGTFLPELRWLHLNACQCITVQGLRRLVQRCPRLVYVDLSYCGVTSDGIPEAGPTCLIWLEEHDSCMVHHLDKETLNKMRRHVDGQRQP